MPHRVHAVFAVLLTLLFPGLGGAGDLMIAPRSPFIVQFGDVTTSYRVLGVYVLPGQEVQVAAYPLTVTGEYSMGTTAGQVTRLTPNQWTWKAPQQTGLYPIEIRPLDMPLSTITLNAFVMVPMSAVKNGKLNGYRIGSYPKPTARNMARYALPRGFIEVTPVTENAQISPNFKLGQFVTKQGGAYPRYVVLREQLALKLESILEEARRRGISAQTFTIMSGYRTPAYNRGLGNVSLSRHQFGDASDIFVDDFPKDGRMDDLNRDGRVDVGDAHTLSQVVEWMSVRAGNEALTGGLGVYTSTKAHGPYIHVDARGFRARWSGSGVKPEREQMAELSESPNMPLDAANPAIRIGPPSTRVSVAP